MAAFLAPPVQAFYLDWSPALTLREEYNGNVNLVRQGGRSVLEHRVVPSLGLIVARPDWRVDGRVSYERRIYGRADGLDSENWRLRLGGRLERPVDLWRIDARFEQRPTIESELLDSGLTQFSSRRTDRRLRPAWRRRLSAVSEMSVELELARVDYEGDAARNGLVDFEQRTTTIALERRWNGSDRSLISLGLLDYRSTDGRIAADDASLRLRQVHDDGAGHRIGFGIGIRHGWTRLRGGAGAGSERQWGGVVDLEGVWHFRRARLDARFSRMVDPTSAGRLQTADRFDLGYRVGLGPRTEAGCALLVLRTRDLAGDLRSTRLDRRYLRLSPLLAWRLGREWRLRGYLAFQRQVYRRSSDGAISRLVGIELVYRPRSR